MGGTAIARGARMGESGAWFRQSTVPVGIGVARRSVPQRRQPSHRNHIVGLGLPRGRFRVRLLSDERQHLGMVRGLVPSRRVSSIRSRSQIATRERQATPRAGWVMVQRCGRNLRLRLPFSHEPDRNGYSLRFPGRAPRMNAEELKRCFEAFGVGWISELWI